MDTAHTPDNWDTFIDSLADEELPPAKPTEKTKYPCGACGGSGKWSRGTNRNGRSDCYPCRGRGYFLTSPDARKAARARTKAQRVSKHDAARSANREALGGHLYTGLFAIADWNSFADSLMEQHSQGRAWSEKQIAAAERMLAKIKASRSARETEAAKRHTAVDLTPIRTMFETAVSSGYKRPKYRAEGLTISRAPDTGKNPGALYVKELETDEYKGKVLGTTYMPARGGETALAALQAIAADPMAAAVRYGRQTGTCACCGRELTNAKSIELGIGPVCRQRWGL